MYKKGMYLGVFLFILVASMTATAQTTAEEVIRKAEDRLRGKTSMAEITMTIVRPSWSRDVSMTSWSKGNDLSLILITGPARDKGTAFLKRDKEVWNWQPTIERVIKLPPSMMMQSWMGSDFTNDDLVRESSTVRDYTHELGKDSTVAGRLCYHVVLTPKEDAPVVWGKVLLWVDKTDYMQLRGEFYDEDGYLVSTMAGKDIREFGGKMLPGVMEMVPKDKPGHKTVIRYRKLEFDRAIDDNLFTIQHMKRLR